MAKGVVSPGLSERAHSPPPVAHKSANLYQKDGKNVKKDRENVKISRTFPKILDKLTQIGLPQSIGSLASLQLHRRGKELCIGVIPVEME